jgi:hypothetical protein
VAATTRDERAKPVEFFEYLLVKPGGAFGERAVHR